MEPDMVPSWLPCSGHKQATSGIGLCFEARVIQISTSGLANFVTDRGRGLPGASQQEDATCTHELLTAGAGRATCPVFGA